MVSILTTTAFLSILGLFSGLFAPPTALPPRPWVIAHRGASAYAPENTVAAFERAIEQGATFVEFDVRRTRDGELIVLHDDTLERTTNAAEVFPDRFRETVRDGKTSRRWPLEDFTLAELRRLDAGAWFNARFAGARVPTLTETIAAVRGRCGLFIEIKSPDVYPGIERQVIEALRQAGLDQPGADARTPVVIQSFSAASLEVFARDLRTPLPLHFLFGRDDAAKWLSPEGLLRVRAFATGLSPHRSVLGEHLDAIVHAQSMGMPVTPWTFRVDADLDAEKLRGEMERFLRELRVDGVITDNPDLAAKPR